MIVNMAMVFTPGKTVDNMLVSGLMENSTAKELTDKVMARRNEASGKMARELNGLMNEQLFNLIDNFNILIK